jgi:hypothetical protein
MSERGLAKGQGTPPASAGGFRVSRRGMSGDAILFLNLPLEGGSKPRQRLSGGVWMSTYGGNADGSYPLDPPRPLPENAMAFSTLPQGISPPKSKAGPESAQPALQTPSPRRRPGAINKDLSRLEWTVFMGPGLRRDDALDKRYGLVEISQRNLQAEGSRLRTTCAGESSGGREDKSVCPADSRLSHISPAFSAPTRHLSDVPMTFRGNA